MLLVIEKVLNAQQLAYFNQELKNAQWLDGGQTAGSLAGQVKNNLQLDDRDPICQGLSQELLSIVAQHPQFVSAALPENIYPPKFNCYREGGHYGLHVDSAIMTHPKDGKSLRSDLSATVFLNEPDSYEGGELDIETPFGAQSVKLAAGDMVLYPSSSLHCVNPVLKGQRLASFFWLQSLVAEEGDRGLLFELDQNIQLLRSSQAEPEAILGLSRLYHNLLRRWAQP